MPVCKSVNVMVNLFSSLLVDFMSTACFQEVFFQSKVFKRGFVLVTAGGLPIIV